MPLRVIAIDWSGNKNLSQQKKKIWLAEADGKSLIRLSNGLSREKLIDDLVDSIKPNAQVVVGFDFAFSFPSWFVTKHGCSSVPEFWSIVEQKAERWLHDLEHPFWGKNAKRPNGLELFRRTELQLQGKGHRPTSVFQIVGASQVGCGSLRGMPVLSRLRKAGFSIWPFDPPGYPLVVEIYPRLLTGPVVKLNPIQRRERLANYQLSTEQCHKAASSDDAFDATVSALEMARHLSEFDSLKRATDRQILLEGMIWYPH